MEWREVRISAGPKGAFHTVPVQATCSLPGPQTAVRTVYISLLLSLFRVDIEQYGTGQNRLIFCGSRRTVPGERRVVRRDTGVIVTLSRRYASTPDQSRAPALSHEHVETPHHGQRKSPVVARNLRAVQRSSGIQRFHAILCSAGILQPKQGSSRCPR